MEFLIPIFITGFMAAVIIFFFYLSHKNKVAIQQTIQKSLDLGNPLTPELLDKLGTTQAPRVKDLKRGIVLGSIGLGCMFASLMINDPEGMVVFRVLGIFPLLVGAAFLLVWKLNRYND
ncbi:MAG: DUF6249 domain-containing protein [Kangiellaceae bacterium]|jgi:hypothetical protein|nr:DUF6249 domain-containing protein [Kangiellaceae bacterium]